MRSLILCSILLASTAAAAEVERLNVTGIGGLDYQRLFEVTSDPGETLDAFALRIGPKIRAYSDETGFEACGVLATDNARFGVVIGTNRSHIACANFKEFIPAGMVPMKQTIHSHGTDIPFKPNHSDHALSGTQLNKVGLGRNSGRPLSIMRGQTLDEFSDADLTGGPGYLAAPAGLVLFQDGSGAVRVVK